MCRLFNCSSHLPSFTTKILDLPSRTFTRLARQRVLKFNQDAAGNIGIAADSVTAEAQRRATQSRWKLAVRTLSYGLWWLREATDGVYFALHTVYALALTPLRSPPPFEEGDAVRFTEDPMEIPGLERGRVYRVKRMVADGRGWSEHRPELNHWSRRGTGVLRTG